ncbi:MAG: tetratricopeptide repeat protein [Myxococcales bacterium]|nr:tetratricopeptide repeat protein [Myxococcales bacterium]
MEKLEIESSGDFQEVAESYIALMAAHSIAPVEIVDEPEVVPRVSWWIRDILIAIAGGLLIGFLAYQALSQRSVSEAADNSVAAISVQSPAPPSQASVEAPALDEKDEQAPTPEESAIAGASEQEETAGTSSAASASLSHKDGMSVERRLQFLRLIARGWKFYQARNFVAASNVFGRAVREQPKKIDGYYGLALALFEQGQDDAACRVLERGARAIGKKSELWLLGGSIYQVLGDEAKAREAYERYLKQNPRGAYAKDIRALLSLESLPRLKPEDLPQMEEEGNEKNGD